MPRPDRPRYPEYYVDCLRFLQDSPDVTKVPWNTRKVREEIFASNTHAPRAENEWVRLGWLATEWKPDWRGIHSTFSTGSQQDVHYLFTHLALPTNLFGSHFRNPDTDEYYVYCRNVKGKIVRRTLTIFSLSAK